MRRLAYNSGYFLREVISIIRLNSLSNVLSFLSIGFTLFILSMVVSGWWMTQGVIEVIQGEAEINVYFHENHRNIEISTLLEEIHDIEGVREVRYVDEEEAYERMEMILGKEASVLKFFDDNPFSPFIEVKIHLEEIDSILHQLHEIQGISHIRDNQEILHKLRSLAALFRYVGLILITAVGISTLVIITHIIRQGIYHNREEIKTLRLLGAPEVFIGFPFFLLGLLLTIGGGIIAAGITAFILKVVYAQISGPLPFIPLPPLHSMLRSIQLFIVLLSIGLGLIGSAFGYSSAKAK